MPSLLPTPEPADPVEGQPGHFEHSNWLKASVKALDSGVVHKAGDTMTGQLHVPSLKLNGNAMVTGVSPGEAGLYNADASTLAKLYMASPTDPSHGANKAYVDERQTGGIRLLGAPNVLGGVENQVFFTTHTKFGNRNVIDESPITQGHVLLMRAGVYRIGMNVTFAWEGDATTISGSIVVPVGPGSGLLFLTGVLPAAALPIRYRGVAMIAGAKIVVFDHHRDNQSTITVNAISVDCSAEFLGE